MKKLPFLLLSAFICFTFLSSCENEPLIGQFATSDDAIANVDCADAILILQENSIALQNATADNYELVCTNYSQALLGLLDSCEDDLDGETIELLQLTLTSLGDCTTSACPPAQAVTAQAASDFEAANDENQEELCTQYTFALQAEIQACGDSDGSLQATINNLPCSNCGAAQINTQTAFEAFDQADPTNEAAYEELCGEYSMALQNQIEICGDPDGSLSVIVLELGDCTPPEEDGPVRLQLEGAPKNFNTAEVTINGSILTIVATDIDTGDTFTFDVVLQQTGSNVLQNVELTVGGIVHTPFLSGDTPFTNSITENTGTTLVGTFTGTVTNQNGDLVTTTSGIIDIEY